MRPKRNRKQVRYTIPVIDVQDSGSDFEGEMKVDELESEGEMEMAVLDDNEDTEEPVQDVEAEDGVVIIAPNDSVANDESNEKDLEEFQKSDTFRTFVELLTRAVKFEVIDGYGYPVPAIVPKNAKRNTTKQKPKGKAQGMIWDFRKRELKCNFTKCTKVFTTYAGIKYHIEKTAHTLEDLFESEHTMSEEMKELWEKLKEMAPSILRQVYPITIPVERYSQTFAKTLPSHVMIEGSLFGALPEVVEEPKQQSLTTPRRDKKIIQRESTGYVGDFPRRGECFKRFKMPPIGNFLHQGLQNYTVSTKEHAQSIYHNEELKINTVLSDKSSSSSNLHLWESYYCKKDNFAIMNCGFRVWAMDWAFSDSKVQYLAVGGFFGPAMNVGERQEGPGCIQIWKYDKKWSLQVHFSHNFGSVLHLRWCQGAVHEGVSLGMLVASFGDGSIRVLDVPFSDQPLYLLWKKSVFQAWLDTPLYRFALNSKNELAAGCSNGYVAVWELYDYLRGSKIIQQEFIKPDMYFELRNTAILNVSWYQDEHIIASSLDGRTTLCHVLDPTTKTQLLMSSTLPAAMLVWDYYFFTTNSENKICFSDLSEWEDDDRSLAPSFKTVFSAQSMFWDTDYSSFHDFAVGVGEDGTLRLYNLQAFSVRGKKSHTIYFSLKKSLSNELVFKTEKKSQVFNHEKYKIEFCDMDLAIHSVAWNHGKETNGMICSGGVGWIRCDNPCI